MKFIHWLALVILNGLLPCSLEAHFPLWQNNYAKVQALSQSGKKPILLFFNGSDWSGSAMRMKHEMLDDPLFQSKIRDHFLCVEIDFPQHMTLPEALSEQNALLKERFHIYEIPSLVILGDQERMIAQIGFLPESGEQLAEDLLRIVEQDAILVNGLQQNTQKAEDLKKFYQIAQELGRQEAIEIILEKGLKTEDPYFMLEQYRLLVEQGEMKSASALALRKKITALNCQESRFTLALIDFQQLSQSDPADSAVAPLIEYLACCGEGDAFNRWKIEMMIAQLYMEGDEKDKALLHAEKALQSAPEGMRDEIAHSLNYIRTIPLN